MVRVPASQHVVVDLFTGRSQMNGFCFLFSVLPTRNLLHQATFPVASDNLAIQSSPYGCSVYRIMAMGSERGWQQT
jgi:hypothetical protein